MRGWRDILIMFHDRTNDFFTGYICYFSLLLYAFMEICNTHHDPQ